MYSSSLYLVSGVTTQSSGEARVLGMDKFSVQLISESNGSNVGTGTLNLQTRLSPDVPYTTIFSNYFDNNSGVLVQFDGPVESIRATMGADPTGTFTVISRHSSSK